MESILYFGTSNGYIIAFEINENGRINEIDRVNTSHTNVTILPVKVLNDSFVFVASNESNLIKLNKNMKIDVYPINCGKSIKGVNLNDQICILHDENVTIGEVSNPHLIQICQKHVERTFDGIYIVNGREIATTFDNTIQLFDTNRLEKIGCLTVDEKFTVNYLCSFDFHGQSYVLVCVGGLEEPKDRLCEDGMIIIFQNGKELEQKVVVKSIPTSIVYEEGFVYVTVGSTIQKYCMKEDGSLSFMKEADALMIASDLLLGSDCLCVVDAFKSVILFDFNLNCLATDYLPKFLITGCSIRSSFIVSDCRGNVYHLSFEKDKVITNGRYSIGENVTSLSAWRPLPIETNFEMICGTTRNGSIITFIDINNNDVSKKLEEVQKKFEDMNKENEELTHSECHAITSHTYFEPCFGFVDMQYMSGIEDLDENMKKELFGESPMPKELQEMFDLNEVLSYY
ncbi:hypothetical protein GPJ56_002739 [Histomonas meleagridis]|uniref:uncharacterized protein n=1 Tax=Histomonas meleagridis TaxID=135588 RepID=UPI0035598A24|nr:hypothetical protein GPJ56_002739 [Histomonas meleagridis]KAH0800046.1 hypothetical protein GO595_007158 [Histomonas meleagridis]